MQPTEACATDASDPPNIPVQVQYEKGLEETLPVVDVSKAPGGEEKVAREGGGRERRGETLEKERKRDKEPYKRKNLPCQEEEVLRERVGGRVDDSSFLKGHVLLLEGASSSLNPIALCVAGTKTFAEKVKESS